MNVAAVCQPQESSVMRSAGIAWLAILGCASLAAAAPPAVMPLGDSITYGRGSGVDIAGGYRSPLYSAVFGIGDYVDLVGSATGTERQQLGASDFTPPRELDWSSLRLISRFVPTDSEALRRWQRARHRHSPS